MNVSFIFLYHHMNVKGLVKMIYTYIMFNHWFYSFYIYYYSSIINF